MDRKILNRGGNRLAMKKINASFNKLLPPQKMRVISFVMTAISPMHYKNPKKGLEIFDGALMLIQRSATKEHFNDPEMVDLFEKCSVAAMVESMEEKKLSNVCFLSLFCIMCAAQIYNEDLGREIYEQEGASPFEKLLEAIIEMRQVSLSLMHVFFNAVSLSVTLELNVINDGSEIEFVMLGQSNGRI